METFCEIILDLENDRSRIKEVSENLPEQMEYVLLIGEHKGIIQFRRLPIRHSFESHRFLRFLVVTFLVKSYIIVIATSEYIIKKLRTNFLKVDTNESRDLLFIERALGICYSALSELRQWISQLNFIDKNDEVYFLKVTKFYVLGKCFFHYKLFEIEAI